MNIKKRNSTEKKLTVRKVNQVLEIGHLLYSILALDEIEELQKPLSPENAIGNTSIP